MSVSHASVQPQLLIAQHLLLLGCVLGARGANMPQAVLSGV
jgi:hypothetical protein